MLPGDAAPARGAPVQTQATTVFAFHYADGVLMAGDRRATAGNVIVTDRVEKIIEVDSTSLLAVAGVPATAFEMARVLQTSFEYYRRSQLQPLSLPARVRALARLVARQSAHDLARHRRGRAPFCRRGSQRFAAAARAFIFTIRSARNSRPSAMRPPAPGWARSAAC